MKLQGKTVLITGGSKGIGRAIAQAMAEQGANIIINYVHGEKEANKIAALLSGPSIKVLPVKADISNPKELDAMFKKIKSEFKTIDVLVNNAGIFADNDSPDNAKVFEDIFTINFLAQVNVTNYARKMMNSGKIIFISSIHAKLGHGRPEAIAYSAMKAALESYMKNLAKALAPEILVNAIEPGRTLTPMWGDMDEAYKAEQAAGHLINRWIEPQEIADGVVFLTKNDAVCGEVLVIDGGMSLKVLG